MYVKLLNAIYVKFYTIKYAPVHPRYLTIV